MEVPIASQIIMQLIMDIILIKPFYNLLHVMNLVLIAMVLPKKTQQIVKSVIMTQDFIMLKERQMLYVEVKKL